MGFIRIARAVSPLVALGVMVAAPAARAEFLGGVAGVSHSVFVSERDLAKSSAAVRLEWGYGPQFKTQIDLGVAGLHAFDDTALNFATHIGWTFYDGGTAGLFYGWDKVDGSQDFYGVEYQRTLGAADVEGYFATVDVPGSNGKMLGLAGRMPVSDSFGVGGSLDYMDTGGFADATRVGLIGDYTVGEATRFSGEIGHFNGDVDGGSSVSEAYVKVGVDFGFGANARTTFGSRSLFNFLPGY